jgi:hypothetical protein
MPPTTPMQPVQPVGVPQPISQPIAPMPQMQPVPFTSNPFLAFGQGLGAGLYKNAGTIMGLSALYLAVLLVGAFFGCLLSIVGFAISPIMGLVIAFSIIALLYLLSSMLLGRGALALTKSLQGEALSIKEAGQQLPANYALQFAGFCFLYGLAIGIGFLLFVVPGLVILARWSLGVLLLQMKK